jgi:hypothetical protein
MQFLICGNLRKNLRKSAGTDLFALIMLAAQHHFPTDFRRFFRLFAALPLLSTSYS